jgi:uncharacterized protein (TIGR03435 family)
VKTTSFLTLFSLISQLAFAVATVNGQDSRTNPKPSFEVASIKAADTCSNVAGGIDFPYSRYQPGGRYTACNQLEMIIRDAYGIPVDAPISGLPDWSKETRYQIEARAKDNPNEEQMSLMTRHLLEERFKLRLHRETRETPVYMLVVAKGGHKLLQAKDENGKSVVSSQPIEEDRDKAIEKLDKVKTARGPAEMILGLMGPGTMFMTRTPGGSMRFTSKAISIEQFATALYHETGDRRVIDKTGLAGPYDIQMEFAQSSLSSEPAHDTEPSPPDIFETLQEQLGLKLESTKLPEDFFIIDSVDKPSEN